jgi:5-methylcytosine-specific restriction endonuclease McrBC GTP-binding regulatory subunit McrB
MDSAFKRRWDWRFIDINSKTISAEGIAFKNENEWISFLEKLNEFIKSSHKYIRGIEDKQIGRYFIKDASITKASIQSKLMFFLWDSVFARDKKPLMSLIYDEDSSQYGKMITFGDFAAQIDLFIEKIKNYNV